MPAQQSATKSANSALARDGLFSLEDDYATTRKSRLVSAKPGAQRRRTGRRRPADAVAVVEQRAGGAVVDDAVVGILRGGADHELAGRDVAEAERAREDRLVQQDRVVRHVEVGDAVDIGRGIERRVEQERVLSAEAGQRRRRRRRR